MEKENGKRELKDMSTEELKSISDEELKSRSIEELKGCEESLLRRNLKIELDALYDQIYEAGFEGRQLDLQQNIEQGIKQIAELYGLDPNAVLPLFDEVVTQRTVQ